MFKRRAGCWAMSLTGCLLAGAAHAEERNPGRVQEPRPLPEPPGQEASEHEERVAGPGPGAPTIGLAQAVSLALERNFAMLGAADNLEAARIRESAAKAQFFPKLTPRFQRSQDDSTFILDASQRLPFSGGSLTAEAILRTSAKSDILPPRTSDMRVVLTQPLLRGLGPTVTNFELANSRRAREDQQRQHELARQRLAVDVAAAFYQVVRERQLLEVARDSLKRSESLRQASEERMKVGLASKLDVYRADIKASQAADAMVSAQAALETALEQFRIFLGMSPMEALEPEGLTPPQELLIDLDPVEVLVARGFENRLELRQARDQVADGRRALSIARQNLLPQVDLNLSLTQSGFGASFGESLRKGDTRLSVFVTTSYPVERSIEATQRAVAGLELAARERTLRQRELGVEAEVRSAARNIERIRKSVELQRKRIELAAQEHRLADLRYQRGLASNLEVVDAEASLFDARTTLVGLLTDYQVARVQLLLATGTLEVEKAFAP